MINHLILVKHYINLSFLLLYLENFFETSPLYFYTCTLMPHAYAPFRGQRYACSCFQWYFFNFSVTESTFYSFYLTMFLLFLCIRIMLRISSKHRKNFLYLELNLTSLKYIIQNILSCTLKLKRNMKVLLFKDVLWDTHNTFHLDDNINTLCGLCKHRSLKVPHEENLVYYFNAFKKFI